MSLRRKHRTEQLHPNIKCEMYTFTCAVHSKMVAYHNFSKALKNVKELLITGCFLKVAYKQCPCGLWVELIYPPIQGPELIFTLRF